MKVSVLLPTRDTREMTLANARRASAALGVHLDRTPLVAKAVAFQVPESATSGAP